MKEHISRLLVDGQGVSHLSYAHALGTNAAPYMPEKCIAANLPMGDETSDTVLLKWCKPRD